MQANNRQLITFLAKINSSNGSGYWSELFVEDYKDQRFKCYRGNLSDKHLNLIKGKWYFLEMEYKNQQLTWTKFIKCDPVIYELMRGEYRRELLAKEKAEKEVKDNVVPSEEMSEK